MSNKSYIKDAKIRLKNWLYFLLPDKLYLEIKFKKLMGYPLNLKDPKTFSEKLQWLKLYNRRPEYTKMVDKYAVKEYVSNIIGQEYIIPTLGVWERVEDIDWEGLPSSFVLKCTHDSGGVVICKDKSSLDREAAIKKLSQSYKNNYYKMWREWPYKNVPKRIIAEEYVEPDSGLNDLPDYKFFCFNGEPKYCQVISGRGVRMCIDFFDRVWKHQPFHEPKNYPYAGVMLQKPDNYDAMWHLARLLAQGISFVRIDFYNAGGRILFGEITFFPTSGMGGFYPEKWDYTFGDMLILPTRS